MAGLVGYGRNIPETPHTRKMHEASQNYKHQDYPKMLTRPCDDDFQEVWRCKNSYIDDRTGKVCYMGAMPKKGSAQPVLAKAEDVELGLAAAIDDPVVVNNPVEEKEAKLRHGLLASVAASAPARAVEVEIGAQDDETVDDLAAENKRLKEILKKRNAELRVQIEASAEFGQKAGQQEWPTSTTIETKAEVPAKKKPGRPKKVVVKDLHED